MTKITPLDDKMTHATNAMHESDVQADIIQSLPIYDNAKQADIHHSKQGILAAVGAYLGGIGKSAQKAPRMAVDLDADDFHQDAFRQQGIKLTNQLLGAKFTVAKSLVGSVAPSVSADGVADFVFDKAAHWAHVWAKQSLSKDSRFAQLSQMSDAKRDDFAKDIANQNRALAVMGGLSGLFGVKGVVADSAWLLMVSLKSVYQLALIYDKPLVGDEGVKLAYRVLSGADLTQLQQKQVILMALALGNAVFNNAKQTSLKQELQAAALKYQTGASFNKQLDELSNYIDIDKFNVSWLGRILPMASVAIGAYYNRELIDEVLGTAMATFRPQQVPLLADNGQSSSVDN